MAHRTLTERLITSLGKSITDKPPYTNGTLQVPDSCFSLLYKVSKDGHAARHINLANATPDELEQLAQACEPASFGVNQENVLDESYRKAGKMDSDCFAPMLDPVHSKLLKIIRGYLLEGTQSTKSIRTELYKLNVYGKGSFFKPHVDTPRGKKMFGSLVIVFPTPHEGGALLLRHRGREWTFDSGKALATKEEPSIGYVAFFSDIEHEVAPVVSGHRVTLTYNLYFDGDTSADEVHPQPANEGAFRETFKALLENPEFLPDGGTLAFGLRHVYPIENNLKHIHGVLKGSDAVVYQSVRALEFEPMLYLYYQDGIRSADGVIIDQMIDFSQVGSEVDLESVLLEEGGILVSGQPRSARNSEPGHEYVEWVTPVTRFNRQEGVFACYGNEASLEWAYGDVCLIVRIGKARDRLEYTTDAELKKEYEGRDDFDYDEDIEEDIEEDDSE